MGLFNKKGQKVNGKEQVRVITEDDGSRKSEYIKKVEAFGQEVVDEVANDDDAKKAIIMIAVDGGEKSAHNTIICGGSEEMLVYALAMFARRKGSKELLRMALNFISHLELKQQFKEHFNN